MGGWSERDGDGDSEEILVEGRNPHPHADIDWAGGGVPALPHSGWPIILKFSCWVGVHTFDAEKSPGSPIW